MSKNEYTTSDNGVRFITRFEGEILHVYDDGFGYPTAGVGHLLTAAEKKQYPIGTKITKEQSRAWLKQDLRKAEEAVRNGVTVPITQNQFDALVSFTFNVGIGGFNRSSVRSNLNNRHFTAAADSLLKWNKAGGKTVKGLTRRREAERELFLTPDKPTSTSSAGPSADPSKDRAGDSTSTSDRSTTATTTAPPATSPTETTVTQEKGDTTLEVTAKNEQDVRGKAKVPAPEPYEGIGFAAVIKRDLTAAFGGNVSLQAVSEYLKEAQGWPEWVVVLITKMATLLILFTLGWFVFRVVHYLVDRWQKNQKAKIEAMINSDVRRKDMEWS